MKPVILGAGLAGLTVALSLAPRPVILISPTKLGGGCASAWAQGGIAAALGADDTAVLHADDTVKAGGGLCDAIIAQQVTADAAKVIELLLASGVVFDRDTRGQLQLGLEGAHSRRRIVHATGDSTGATIMQALIAAVRATPSIEIIENAIAVELLVDDGMTGVVIECDGQRSVLSTQHVVLATGGAGALWQHTTNPLGSWGQGLALAAHAGAELGDLEFMQFHPTAIDIGRDPMPLASEAIRGEGAILIDDKGERFVDELAPRDVVARAIWNHWSNNHRVFLDAREALGAQFATRFPAIHAVCLSAGIDPARDAIPVRPAAHYHMGGVVTGAHGRTNVKGLWACGEVACTGLHGANRLASNSLLEAVSFGRRVAEDIIGLSFRSVESNLVSYEMNSHYPKGWCGNDKSIIRGIMSSYVGLLRDRPGLETATDQLSALAEQSDMALVGLMIATAALRREESRGAHIRSDYPLVSEKGAKRQILTLQDVMPLDTPKRKRA